MGSFCPMNVQAGNSQAKESPAEPSGNIAKHATDRRPPESLHGEQASPGLPLHSVR